MPSILSRITFFLSSFSPLLVVFALLDTWGRGTSSLVCTATAVLSIAGLFVFMRLATKYRTFPLRVKVARRKDAESLTYIATFLVPFFTISIDSLKQKIALAIFMLLIASFYVSGETYFWNPLLSAVGYRVLEIEFGNTETATLITRRKYIATDAEILAVRLAYNVFWEPRDER